jgi:GWxTD domain-containing protein
MPRSRFQFQPSCLHLLRCAWLAAAVVGLMLVTGPAAADPASEARALLRDGLRRWAIGTPEQRQFARGLLESAHRLQPADPEIALALGDVYLASDMIRQARRLAALVAQRDSSSAAAHFLAGASWRRDWLTTCEPEARDHAIASLAHGLKLAPRDFTHGQMLVPLLEDAGEPREALQVAELAARAGARKPEAWLLLGYAAQFAGDIGLADRMFAKAIPALPPAVRVRYEDLSPLFGYRAAQAYRALAPAARATRNQRFWRAADPDPVSSENEAQLEFFARLTHALLLYGVDDLGELDARAQLYVRFGAPALVERNSLLNPQSITYGTWQSWTYPELGMRAWLNAANPLGHYRARYGTAVYAFPESLARRPELQGTPGGWAVFRAIPAGLQPLAARCALARFDGTDAPSLHAQVEAAAGPERSLAAHWAVLDTAFAVVARAETELKPSACDATGARTASYVTTLSPGRYRVAVRADDDDGRRAVLARDIVIPIQQHRLKLSDLVVVCGPPELSIQPTGGVRLEPSTGLLPVGGDQLNAYCEIYHLAPDAQGDARYEYVCRVTSNAPDKRSWAGRLFQPRLLPSPIEVTRRETTRGDLRRQYFSVPIHPLPPGPYRIEIRVRDLGTGAEAMAQAEFERR